MRYNEFLWLEQKQENPLSSVLKLPGTARFFTVSPSKATTLRKRAGKNAEQKKDLNSFLPATQKIFSDIFITNDNFQ